MPNSAIVSALTSLLPSLPASNKPFPPLLLSQSESLLALSRQRAANLKLEEEIARPHACAEIACTRLRAQLRLPAIKNGAGAPCQPRVYAKLLKFLEGALGDVSVGSLTPRGRKRDGNGNLKESSAPGSMDRQESGTAHSSRKSIGDTPTKKRVVNSELGSTFAGSIKSKRKTKAVGAGPAIDDRAHQFVMPLIRKLCTDFSTPSMVPHVYTGTCIVLQLAKLWDQDTEIDDILRFDILTLITALYLMVLTRMKEGEMTTDLYTEISTRSVKILELGEGGTEKVEEWISRLNDEGWCNGQDWWDTIPEGSLTFGTDANGEDLGEGALSLHKSQAHHGPSLRRSDLASDDLEGVLLPGLGTMLHDGIDWTSEDKSLDYQEWLSKTMKSLETPNKTVKRRGKAVSVN